MKHRTAEIEDDSERLQVYVDGSFDEEKCSYGYVVLRHHNKLASGAGRLNPKDLILNVEYTGIMATLDDLLRLGFQHEDVVVFNDNQGVMRGLRALNPLGTKGPVQAEYHFNSLEFIQVTGKCRHVKTCHFLAHAALHEPPASDAERVI